MKELLRRTLDLCSRHIALWVPCSVAGILAFGLGELQRIEIRWVYRFFATQHSMLGGEVLSSDLAQVQHRTMLVMYPLGLLKVLLEVCLFVMALAATSNLVQMLREKQAAGIIAAVRRVFPRFAEVLLFSVKYVLALTVIGAFMIVLTGSPLASERVQRLLVSKAFLYLYGLAVMAGIAWLLVPSAIRLLRPPGDSTVSNKIRRLGVVIAVAATAGTQALQYLVGKLEAGAILKTQWERVAISVVNTLVVNAPQVLLFIALSLLAVQQLTAAAPALDSKTGKSQ